VSVRRGESRQAHQSPQAVPPEVRILAEEWRTQGKPRQRAIPWPRERWLRAFPDRARAFERLPDQLDRDAVRAAVGYALARGSAIDAFLPCMAWGFGRVGYGPHRVGNMLGAGTRTVEPKLAAVARAAAAGKPLDAYTLLAGPSRLEGLGPAFGTKFIHFVDRRGLILDRIIAGSLARVSGLSINAVPWDRGAYARYLMTMERWADDLRIGPDDLEQVLFTAESRLAGNQWGDEASG
jgi:hypothetical protein